MKALIKKLLVPVFFILLALYFIYLQWAPVFPDPDSFYHTKLAVLMGQDGLIKNFPWIKYTSFTQNFTDHHLLYHLLLVPFVKIFPPLIGAKIITAILAGLSIFCFYSFLKKWKIRYALIYTLVLVSVIPFVFRMNLTKTSALSLIILIISLNFVWQKRYWWLLGLSFIYVWAYGGWSILLILTACQLLAEMIISTKEEIADNSKLCFLNNLKQLLKRADWKIPTSVCGGCILGLIINPYFPQNIYFYWEQVIQIGLVNYQNTIPVGLEWYPFQMGYLIATTIFIILFASLTFLAFLSRSKKQETVLGVNEKKIFQQIFCLFLFSGLLILMTGRSQRFIEYSAPFFILALAWLLDFSLPKNFSLKIFISEIVGIGFWNKFMIYFPASLLIIYLIAGGFKLHQQMTGSFSWNYLAGACNWLKNNTPTRSLIFHSTWSDSTIMFYHNDHNIYIAGLDPTFFYRYDPKLYEEWTWIRSAKVGRSLAKKLTTDFDTHFILIKNDEKPLLNIVEQDTNFNLRYQDQEAKIFEVK